MAKPHPYEPHCYSDEVPDCAIAPTLKFIDAYLAGDPGFQKLVERLGLDWGPHPSLENREPRPLIISIFMGLINEARAPEVEWTLDFICGAEAYEAVYAIFRAWEDDPGFGPPEGLEDRIRERVATGICNRLDIQWMKARDGLAMRK